VSTRRSPVELLAVLAVAAVQVAAAYVVLGRPDLGQAWGFLTGTDPTMTGSVAAAQLVLWAGLAVTLVGLLVALVTGALSLIGGARRTGAWSLAVVAIGLVILVAGAVHRASSTSDTIAGGSLQEARAQLAR
jgi:hypothetical protein